MSFCKWLFLSSYNFTETLRWRVFLEFWKRQKKEEFENQKDQKFVLSFFILLMGEWLRIWRPLWLVVLQCDMILYKSAIYGGKGCKHRVLTTSWPQLWIVIILLLFCCYFRRENKTFILFKTIEIRKIIRECKS